MRIAFIVVAALPAMAADAISIGIKAGVPLTDVVKTAGEIGGRPFQADVKRFTIGPVLNLRLPFGLGFEFGALYKRFDQQAGQIQAGQSVPYSATGASWEFPLVGQYRFPGILARPYVEAGVAFNRLNSVLAPFRSLSPVPITQPAQDNEHRKGLVLGAGLDLKLPILHVSPGLRYTRYGEAQPWLPGANSVDFLVGFTF